MDKLIADVPFFQAPNSIFECEDLNIYEKIVYIYLCRCGNNAKAFPSYNTIAKKCGIGRTKAVESVSSLIKKNYITKTTRTNPGTSQNFSNIYEVIFK
jgi:predicted transcriptional regulator